MLLGLAIGAGLTVAAEPAEAASEASTLTPIQRWNAATTMADWARGAGDPLVLIAAARVLLGAGVPYEPDSGDPWNPARLLADARELAADRTVLLAMIEEAIQSRERGVFQAMTRVEGRIEPGVSLKVNFVFPPGTLSDAAARAAEGAGLGMVIRDSADRVVASGSGSGAKAAYAQWRSDSCTPYTLELVNTGSRPVDVVLAAPPTRQQCDD